MELQNWVALVSTLFTLFLGSSSDLQLCKHVQETTHISNLNMDSSAISGTTGMCSCKIQLIHGAKLSLFPVINIPGCSTVMSLSDTSFLFRCVNGKVENGLPFNREMMAGDELWLFVKSTHDSSPISGNLQIKTDQEASKVSVTCFNANKNTTETTKTTLEANVTITSQEGPLPATSTVSTRSTGSTTFVYQSPTANSLKEGKEKEFPVAAVAGGVAGGLTLVLIVISAVVCSRRRKRESKNKGNPYENKGHEEQIIDENISAAAGVKLQTSYLPENNVHVENCLYESVDIDNLPHHSQVDLMDSVPSHYASPDELNFEKPKARKLEGSETVVASSDLYAVVDKSKKHLERNVTNQNHTASQADVYAVVDKPKKYSEQKVTNQNPTANQADVYAVVDKSKKQQEKQVTDANPTASPGDVYAVVQKKKKNPQEAAHMLSPTAYAVVDVTRECSYQKEKEYE